MDSPDTLLQTLRDALEKELQAQLNGLAVPPYQPYHEMLAYHMGWIGIGAGPQATGKRIRPLLLLLCTAASRGDWQKALPAAAAVEFVHNFSLIHDDIEDDSQYRRGRLTVWAKWGLSQGVNAGDALFTLSHLAIHNLSTSFPAETVLHASKLLLETCLRLTQGQFLDISFEDKTDISLDDYLTMIEGKTAALFATCTQLGSLLGHCDQICQNHYRQFGRYLGLAFQVVDDLLGVWGDESLIGKSTASDLVSGKKTYPIILGLQANDSFARRWRQGNIQPEEVVGLAKQLEKEGVKAATQAEAHRLTQQAFAELDAAQAVGLASQALYQMTKKMSQRIQ